MKKLDLTNQVFGELTALVNEKRNNKLGWLCQCSCGNQKWFPTFQLTGNNAKTCGDSIHSCMIKLGDVFGKLTVTGITRDVKNKRHMAECSCECGNTKTISVRNLQRGTSNCGCKRDTTNLGLPEGVAIFNALVRMYKGNAINKGLIFELSDEQCRKLFSGNCYFCGKPPSKVFSKPNVKGTITYSSIDRWDSTKGYTSDNVSSCCTECNFLKGARTNKEFLDHIQCIYEHLSKCF